MARRVLDPHGRIRPEKKRLVLQLRGIVEPGDALADAAAAMRTHDLDPRKILQNAAHDQPRQREAEISWAADAGGEAIVLHALFAEAHMGRVNHHRNVEVLQQLPEAARFVVVRLVTLVARIYR